MGRFYFLPGKKVIAFADLRRYGSYAAFLVAYTLSRLMKTVYRVMLVCALMLGHGWSGAQAVRADHPSVTFGGVGAGPISTFSGATLPQGSSAWAFRVEDVIFDRFSDAQLLQFGAQDIHADSVNYTAGAFFSGAYGVTNNLTLMIRMPYYYQGGIREPERHGADIEVEDEGDAVGAGDILGLAMLRLFNLQDETLQISFITGVEAPTGWTSDITRQGTLFEAEHQPGSGSWDPVVGLSGSKSRDRFSVHANVLYVFTGRGIQETNLGDILNYNLAFVYRIGRQNADGQTAPTFRGNHDDQAHDHHDDASHDHDHKSGHDHDKSGHDHEHDHKKKKGCTLDLMVEFNGFWQDMNKINDSLDVNTGGNLIFFAPGVRLNVREHYSAFFSVGIPMIQNQFGENHEVAVRLIWGGSLSF